MLFMQQKTANTKAKREKKKRKTKNCTPVFRSLLLCAVCVAVSLSNLCALLHSGRSFVLLFIPSFSVRFVSFKATHNKLKKETFYLFAVAYTPLSIRFSAFEQKSKMKRKKKHFVFLCVVETRMHTVCMCAQIFFCPIFGSFIRHHWIKSKNKQTNTHTSTTLSRKTIRFGKITANLYCALCACVCVGWFYARFS